jgi:rod shape-determining protein MreC
MRNLIFFLYKYHTFLLFFALQIIALTIFYRYNAYQRASFLNVTGGIANNFYETVNNTKNYFYLKRINDSLMVENARLRNQMLNAYYHTGVTSTFVTDTAYQQQYEYIAATVVNNSVIYRNNYLTLDKGSYHGIKQGMGVVTNNGVVGIVMSVSKNFCTVLSVLNSNSKISAMLKKNNAFGSLVWDGVDPTMCNLLDVNKHVDVKVNDEVVTSNYSKLFPQGLPIGSIYTYRLEPGDNFYTIKVKLNVDFSTLKTVYIIRNLLKEEQQTLENQSYKIDN